MQREYRPLSEPATPFGVGGVSGLATTDLALATVTQVRRRNSEVTILRLFAFYGNNVVVAVTSSETTEPFIPQIPRSNSELV